MAWNLSVWLGWPAREPRDPLSHSSMGAASWTHLQNVVLPRDSKARQVDSDISHTRTKGEGEVAARTEQASWDVASGGIGKLGVCI